MTAKSNKQDKKQKVEKIDTKLLLDLRRIIENSRLQVATVVNTKL